MLRRLFELAQTLMSAPLTSDDIGDDHEHAAVAMQALSMIFANREARAAVARWEWMTNEHGRRVQRLRPENAPTPEEQAGAEKRVAEMCADGQAPGLRLFDPASTTLRNPNGSEITSHAQYQRVMAAKGLAEATRYDVRNSDASKRKADVEKAQRAEFEALMHKAFEFGKATGQFDANGAVVPGAPVIPLPAPEKAPAPQKRSEQTDEAVESEVLPAEKRRRVDTSNLEANLMNNAVKSALARAGVPTGANGSFGIGV